jgi:NAD(P)H-hydrate epimerase
MDRSPTSHKGQNGVVAVVGGSLTMHGAPTFAALAAEAAGVDLIHPCIPERHETVIRSFSPNFICHTFRNDDLGKSDVSAVEEVLKLCCSAVIGPGLASFESAQKAMKQIITNATIPLVVDGAALQPWTFDALNPSTGSGGAGKPAVLTPHAGELARMQGVVLKNKSHEELKDLICTIAKERGLVILLKGAVDIIAGPKGCSEVSGGNAGLTKGGTGDVLAGLIAGLIALRVDPEKACVMATTIVKRAAEELAKEKGFAFTTLDVIQQIPQLLHTYE